MCLMAAEKSEYKKCKRETKKKTWFMPNNILLIFSRRMAEHSAVIYVYCDFNSRLPHSPKRLHAERFVLATLHNEGIHVCNGLCCGSLEQQNRWIYSVITKKINNSTVRGFSRSTAFEGRSHPRNARDIEREFIACWQICNGSACVRLASAQEKNTRP